jgi:hypothetical protein
MAATKKTLQRRARALLAVKTVAVLTIALALIGPAVAQFFDQRFPDRSRRQQQQPGFFFPFFFPGPAPPRHDARPAPPVDSSRAPPSRKHEQPPTDTIVVAGDSMADWLAYGLEDTLADTPELGVLRKARHQSGLIRYEPRNDTSEWAPALRVYLANEKPKAIIMMVGLHDRQSIRERAPPPQNEREQSNTSAPEPRRTPTVGNHEFRSERWVELYIKRIDDTITALKSKGVPILWVGLPAIRGPRASSDMSFLNDLYRTRAEKAGIVYVDVWDGFVDEAGRFATSGPDPEGQTRRLRAGDGVHFTKAGARKLAHFVERDLRRVLSTRAIPVALPTEEEPLQTPARPGVPAPRPVAGPVVPLTTTSAGPNELLGAGALRPASADPMAMRVLTRGEAVAAPTGRADDFSWPRRAPTAAEPVAATPAATPVSVTPTDTPAIPGTAAAPARKPAPPDNAAAPVRKPVAQETAAAPARAAPRPQPRRPPPRSDRFDAPPRPPLPILQPFFQLFR